MGFFQQLYKSTFCSQILLGIVAILALPISLSPHKAENNSIYQTFTLSDLVAQVQSQADDTYIHIFLQNLFSYQEFIKQAVTYCQFFAVSYCFDTFVNPPIRAGPVI